MTYTYCMTSNCAPAETCTRYEDDAGKHLLTRTYAPQRGTGPQAGRLRDLLFLLKGTRRCRN